MLTTSLVTLGLLVHGTVTSAQGFTTFSITSPGAARTPSVTISIPSITFSTAIASPSVPLSSPIPSEFPLPPNQAWCPSEIFCAGSLLQAVNIAGLYADSKTFVDKPTNKTSQVVLSDFHNLTSSAITEGAITQFVDADFRGEGLELEALRLSSFNPDPPFLKNVSDPLLRVWTQTVHGFWTQLIRGTNSSTLCTGGDCESSLIPLNHTFVVPGGRFREQYYWDSFWIIEGLIESQLFDVVNATLQNFMDELESFGFIPNGGRIYYLNRSQPPLFIHMLSRYVTTSNDTSILERALPLAEAELSWWTRNRTVNVTSPFTNTTHTMARYAVNNTAPRPESYLTDYLTAHDPTSTTLNDTQLADLYGELASGAETGWDYSTRWTADDSSDLRTLNVKNIIPVCLNSILYGARVRLAELYSTTNSSASSRHLAAAAAIRDGILDLFWDPTKLAFYDFNLASNARNSIFTAATWYPLWNGIVPPEVLNDSQQAFGVFAALNMVLNRYNGTFPTTFIESGLQWDAPNAWPPHQYIALQALRALPSNVTSGALPTPSLNQSTFDLIPAGQLGLMEGQLPGQPIRGTSRNATTSGPATDLNSLNGTVLNGGNATSGEGWAHVLQRELANRYMASAICSWHATGGSIPGVLPRLSEAELNVTQSANNTGNMFEKFSNMDIDSAGSGGEYTVQAGFGWTNGAVLWVASNYGDLLVAPQCPSLLAAAVASTTTASTTSTSAATSSGSPTSTSSPENNAAVGSVKILGRARISVIFALASLGSLLI